MVNIYDEDLEFLSKIEFKDLDDLVFIINYYRNEKQEYVEKISKEVRLASFKSLVSLFENEKYSLYKDILIDVCKQLEVNFDKDSQIKIIENSLFMRILEEAINKMPKKDFEKMIDEVKKENKELFDNTHTISKEILLTKFQLSFENKDFKSYILTTMIVNAILKAFIGRGLAVKYAIVTDPLTQFMKFITGPIGWIITAIWTNLDISSIYKGKILTVIYIAYLRQKYFYRKEL